MSADKISALLAERATRIGHALDCASRIATVRGQEKFYVAYCTCDREARVWADAAQWIADREASLTGAIEELLHAVFKIQNDWEGTRMGSAIERADAALAALRAAYRVDGVAPKAALAAIQERTP